MEIHLRRRPSGPWPFGPWWLGLIPGVLCVLFGILIVAAPQLLQTMVAGAFVLIGFLLITAAWRLRPPPTG